MPSTGWASQDRVDRAIGRDARAGAPARAAGRAARPQVEGRGIAPVQVLEHQHERASRRAAPRALRRISRSMRSRVPPRTSRCSASRSASAISHGICASQVGARSRNAATASLPPARHRRPSASSSGRYASPGPKCSRHCPRATAAPPGTAVRATNASTKAVLPMPSGPVTNTTCRSPRTPARRRPATPRAAPRARSIRTGVAPSLPRRGRRCRPRRRPRSRAAPASARDGCRRSGR